jgi:hypothetical protein
METLMLVCWINVQPSAGSTGDCLYLNNAVIDACSSDLDDRNINNFGGDPNHVTIAGESSVLVVKYSIYRAIRIDLGSC